MSAEHDNLRILPDAVRQLEDKVFVIQEHIANELIAESKRNVSVFSDAQTDRVETIVARAIVALLGSDAFSARVAKEFTFITGAQSLRFILWLVGSLILSAISFAVGYWTKTH
jgi:hypothetical protein